MAGEDLLEGTDGGANDTDAKKGKKKPLSKGQKIGVAIGATTIVLVLVQIERSKGAASTSTSTTTPIDPLTGDPEGSAADQAALSAMQNGTGSSGDGAGGGYYSSPSSGSDDGGTDPATGATYSSEIAGLVTANSALGTDFTNLEAQWSSLSSNPNPPATGTTPPPTSTTPAAPHGASPLQSANLANLEAELKRDQTGKPTANKTRAVKTLNKQIAAVKARS
jgi:hypothetical protein